MAKKKKIEVVSEESELNASENRPEELSGGDEVKIESEKESDNKGEFDIKEEKITEDISGEENLKKELEEAKARANENWESFLRARADYENFKKRSENQISQSLVRGKKIRC